MSIAFQPYTAAAVPVTAPYFRTQTDRLCDYTVGISLLWRDYFQCRYAIAAECLILQATYGGRAYFTVPLGSNGPAALEALEAHCAATGTPLRFATVSARQAAQLQRRYPAAEIRPQTELFDYLYRYGDLATLAGRRYSGQRNHIRHFISRYPQWQYRTATAGDVPDMIAFIRDVNRRKSQSGALYPAEIAEQEGCSALLSLIDSPIAAGCRLSGGILSVDGAIAAIALGEIVGDTLYVHLEKGDTRYEGAYPMIVREFAAHTAAPGVEYINREDDAGDAGLRRSKHSYHPCALIEKYTVTIDR